MKGRNHASCFVGVSTELEKPWTGGSLVLDDSPNSKYPYSASCNVAYADGKIFAMTLVTQENKPANHLTLPRL